MPRGTCLRIDGVEVEVAPGSTVAAAVAIAGGHVFRRSTQRRPRGPLCGMGICFECRVNIDGRPHVRACMVVCTDGMRVQTDA